MEWNAGSRKESILERLACANLAVDVDELGHSNLGNQKLGRDHSNSVGVDGWRRIDGNLA